MSRNERGGEVEVDFNTKRGEYIEKIGGDGEKFIYGKRKKLYICAHHKYSVKG